MGMPKGLAKATNYYNNIEARRDFYRLAHEVVSAGHSEIVRKHIPPESAGWRKIDKCIAALRAEWQAFQQGLHTDAAIVPPAEHVQNLEIVPAGEVDSQPRR